MSIGNLLLTVFSPIAIALYAICIVALKRTHGELTEKFNPEGTLPDDHEWCILSMDYNDDQMLTYRWNRCEFTIIFCGVMIGGVGLFFLYQWWMCYQIVLLVDNEDE